jgi:hypothetical protein
MKTICISLATIAALLAPAAARAEHDEDTQAGSSVHDVLDGDYSAFLHGPASGARATLVLSGGWDDASSSARADANGWLPVYGRFSLLLGAHLGASETWRPSAGVAIALLAPHGEGATLHLVGQFKAEGFTEPEGELELTVRSGYRFAHASLVGEVSYGQDPEGNERDAELATAATFVRGAWSAGLGARARTGFGRKQERVAWDLVAGPHIGLVVGGGHYVGVGGGLSLLSIDDETRAGALGLASYAIAY